MTDEERTIISQFIARVGGSPATTGSAFGTGSVPQTQPALPPVDRDADGLIGGLFQQYPEARYRITQLAFVQEHALVEAQNRIQRLQWENQQAQQALQQARQAPQQGSGGGGFFSGLFGGGNRQQSAPPPGGAWNQQGGPQQGLRAATAPAAISAGLSAGHVPTPRPGFRIPGFGLDHRSRRGRRYAGGERTDEPVLRWSHSRPRRRGGWRSQPMGNAARGSTVRRQLQLGWRCWRRRRSGREPGLCRFRHLGTIRGGTAPPPDDSGSWDPNSGGGGWDAGGGGGGGDSGGWDSAGGNNDDTF